MDDTDKVEEAIKRIVLEWPRNPRCIYTSPDGVNVYRSMRTDICPDIFKNDKGTPNKQLYKVNDVVVGKDRDYGNKENKAW